jgi:hypothetical protein
MGMRKLTLGSTGLVLWAALLGATALPALAAEPPTVAANSTSVTEATATSAVLDAEIDPGGEATTYHFEYDTTPYTTGATHGQSTPESASIGADESEHPVTTTLDDLQPGTVYHYRVVATNASAAPGGVDGPDETFTTQSGGSEFRLPDERAWEQVSPVDKHGARVEPITNEGGVIQAAVNGSAITYVADAPAVAEQDGNPSYDMSQMISVRGAGGAWASRDITLPHGEASGVWPGYLAEYEAFSPDLSSGIVEPHGAPQLAANAKENTIFIRQNLLASSGSDYDGLINDENVLPGTIYGGEHEQYAASSNNGQSIAFSSLVSLNPKLEEEHGLYEVSNNIIHPVSLLPDGQAVSVVGKFIGYQNASVRNAVSENGEKVFWEAEVNSHQELYMRNTSQEATVQINLPEGGGPEVVGAAYGASFQYASSNGERVYFTDDQALTPGAMPEYTEPDLYEYNTVSGKLKDLTPAAGADVRGDVIGVSTSGEYVYFAAKGALAEDAPSVECGAFGGVCLYVARVQGENVKVSLVAVLSGEDSHDWVGPAVRPGELTKITSRVSPNGRYLAFMSDRSLTGYDNVDAVGHVPDEEVFEYDAAMERLVCASCDPSGARPHGVYDPSEGENSGEGLGLLVDRHSIWEERWLAGSVPGWTNYAQHYANYQSRYLEDDGRLFFDSADALVAQDTNQKEDVYEYEPEGVGSEHGPCGPPSASGSEAYEPPRAYEVEGVEGEEAAGCVGLISSGKSDKESAFLDAGESGNDVFFLTSSPLSSTDADDAGDVYDAHVCSGASPCAGSVVAPPPCTTADSCKAALTPQPAIFGAPASSTFAGQGNVAPAVVPVVKSKAKSSMCKKRFVKKHSKCVKAKRSKRARRASSHRSAK